jgi:hypothetical protein
MFDVMLWWLRRTPSGLPVVPEGSTWSALDCGSPRAFSQSLRRAVAIGAMRAVLPRADRARAAPSRRQQRG